MPKQEATIQQIRTAGTAISKKRPAYVSLMDYFMDVFAAQEDTRASLQLAPPTLDAGQVAEKLAEGFPAATLADFSWDARVAKNLMVTLCGIVAAHQPNWADSARRLSEALASGQLDPEPSFQALFAENDTAIAETADAFDIDPQMFASMLYNSLQPAIRHVAEQVSAFLEGVDQKRFTFCPICGTPPALSVIRDNGERDLACGFCWTEWPVRRVACPHCGNTDGQSLHYFYDSAEKEYRVGMCRKCSGYIKTIDLRELDRPLYLPLEQVASMHLDMKAEEELERNAGAETESGNSQ